MNDGEKKFKSLLTNKGFHPIYVTYCMTFQIEGFQMDAYWITLPQDEVESALAYFRKRDGILNLADTPEVNQEVNQMGDFFVLWVANQRKVEA